VLFQYGLLPQMGDGMESEVDEVSVIEAKLRGMLDKGLLKTPEVDLIQGVSLNRLGNTLSPAKRPSPGSKAWSPAWA
jgi:hypothetical protein